MTETIIKPWELNTPDKYYIENPKFIEENNLQFIYWKSLLYISHFLVDACRYDPITGKAIHQSLTNVLTTLNKETKKTDIIPEDNIYRTCKKNLNALDEILNNPRKKIHREHLISPIHKVKEIDTRCMAWLSKQPGKKIREKIGAKQKAMTVIRNTSFDILENRVVVRFIKDFIIFLSNRLKWLPNTNEKDIKVLIDTFKLLKTLPDSPLVNVKRAIEIKPNNVLLSDKKYNRIWRAVHWLKHYDEEIKLLWDNGINRLTSLIYWRIIAKLSAYENVIIFDEFCKVEPGFNTHHAGIVFNRSGNWNNIDKDAQIIELYTKGDVFHSIKIGLKDTSIAMIVNKFNGDKILSKTDNGIALKFDYKFELDDKDDLMFSVQKNAHSDSSKYDIYKMDINSCDLFVDTVTKILEEYCTLGENSEKKNEIISDNRIGFNLSLSRPHIYNINGIKTQNKRYLYSSKQDSPDRADYIVGLSNRNLNLDTNKIYSFNDFWHEIDNTEITDSLYRVLKKITEDCKFSSSTDIAIAFPDSLDEFSQNEMRSSISTLFGSISFPWRSVSALLGWQTLPSFNSSNIKKGTAVIILDTDSPEFTFSCLIAHDNIELKDYSNSNGIYWERRPLFIEISDLEKLSFIQFQRDYLNDYIDEYFNDLKEKEKIINFLINTGKAEEIIINRESVYIPSKKTNDRWMKFNYNPGIIDKISDKWFVLFEKKFLELKNKIIPGNIKASIPIKKIQYAIFGELIKSDVLKSKINVRSQLVFLDSIDYAGIGSASYLDRKNRKLETYKDWVPELWLKGQSKMIRLSEGRLVTPGDKISETINKILELPADQKFIAFPLSRDEKHEEKIAFEAILESSHFPLSETLDVKMKVEYTYGEGAFKLILSPLDPGKAPFKKLDVKWKRGDEGAKQIAASIKNERPQMHAKIKAGPVIKNIVKIIDDFENQLNKLNKELNIAESKINDDMFISNGKISNVEDIKNGMIFKGRVKSITRNGALFIDNGYGVDSYMQSPNGKYSVGDVIYSVTSSIKEKKTSVISCIEEFTENILVEGRVIDCFRNNLVVDLGIGITGEIVWTKKQYNKNDIIYVKKEYYKENKPIKVDDFEDLGINDIVDGEVVGEYNGAHFIDIGIEKDGFLPNNGRIYEIGENILIRILKINKDEKKFVVEKTNYQKLILKDYDKFKVELKNINIELLKKDEFRNQKRIFYIKTETTTKKSLKSLELEIKKLLLANFDKLSKTSISNINKKIIPFLDNYKNIQDLLFYFGDYCPDNNINSTIEKINIINNSIEIEKNELEKRKLRGKLAFCYHLLGRALGNNMDNIALEFIIDDISKNKSDINRPLGAFANGILKNEKLLFNVNKKIPALIENFLAIIEKRYKNIQKGLIKDKSILGTGDHIILLRPFQYNNELLFGLLMLRGEDNDLFKAGSFRILKIAEKIIEIDKVFMKHGHECKSRFNFEISPKDEKKIDRNMSRFVYILNSYLTGEDVSSRVRIKDIILDDE